LELIGFFKPSDKFDSFYYKQLSDKQKHVFKAMTAGIKMFTKEIEVPLLTMDEISMIFNYIMLDNPMFYYVSAFKQITNVNNQKCIIKPVYKYIYFFIMQKNKTIKGNLQIFNELKCKSELEKELYVHDYCLDNFKYDNTFSDYSYTVLGPVLNNTAVCEGIAKFVKLTLDYLGVKNMIVHGKAKNPVNNILELHTWNIVIINGKKYHLDVTFDMTLKNKINRYDYFNLCDEDIKKDHIIINNLPACLTAENDYYSLSSSVVNTPGELEVFINKKLIQKIKTFIVKIKNVKDKENIVNRVISIAQQQYQNIFNCGVKVEVNYNISQLIFEVSYI